MKEETKEKRTSRRRERGERGKKKGERRDESGKRVVDGEMYGDDSGERTEDWIGRRKGDKRRRERTGK